MKTPYPLQGQAEVEQTLPSFISDSLLRFDSLLQDLVTEHQHLSTRLLTITQDLLFIKTCTKDTAGRGIKRQRKLPAVMEHCPESWKWRLSATSAISKVVCKGKYFEIQVRLEPLAESQLSPDLTIDLCVQLFASDNLSDPISLNMNGEPIMRGSEGVQLSYDPAQSTHTAQFTLQITEVSSHYVNGWVRLSIAPEPGSPFAGLVEPMIVDSLVVRAKEKTCRRFEERELAGKCQQRVRNFPKHS
jgi:hypothetical protein